MMVLFMIIFFIMYKGSVMWDRTEVNLATKSYIRNLEQVSEIINIGEGGFDFAFTITGYDDFNASVGSF
jgi:hypothetical protein